MWTTFGVVFNLVFFLINAQLIRSGQGLGINTFAMGIHFLAVMLLMLGEARKSEEK